MLAVWRALTPAVEARACLCHWCVMPACIEPVNDIVRVNELERLDELEENFPDLGAVESLRVLLQLLEDGPLHVLEHQIKLPAQAKHHEQRDDVLVAQLLQDADLAQSRLANLLVLVGLLWGRGGAGQAGAHSGAQVRREASRTLEAHGRQWTAQGRQFDAEPPCTRPRALPLRCLRHSPSPLSPLSLTLNFFIATSWPVIL